MVLLTGESRGRIRYVFQMCQSFRTGAKIFRDERADSKVVNFLFRCMDGFGCAKKYLYQILGIYFLEKVRRGEFLKNIALSKAPELCFFFLLKDIICWRTFGEG